MTLLTKSQSTSVVVVALALRLLLFLFLLSEMGRYCCCCCFCWLCTLQKENKAAVTAALAAVAILLDLTKCWFHQQHPRAQTTNRTTAAARWSSCSLSPDPWDLPSRSPTLTGHPRFETPPTASTHAPANPRQGESFNSMNVRQFFTPYVLIISSVLLVR